MRQTLPVWALSLGCPKNRVDTENFLGSLGMEIKLCRAIGQSRLVFINTCAFIEPGTRESIRAILDAAQKIKKLKRKPLLVVAGCLPGRYSVEELARELPEVDLWLPASQFAQWPELIKARLELDHELKPGRLLTQAPSAYLKIAEGCRHNCAFCAIPAIRGTLKSEPAHKITRDARLLIEHGAKELVLVAQDTASWGKDLPGETSLPRLLENLCALSGLEWLRLLYLYPNMITDELLYLMDCPPLLPYLDIPLQHSEPRILKAMGRPFSVNAREIVEKIRARLPGAALRTTFIVGFPGETEADFENLCAFTREARFHNMGVFTYFAEEGTKAADFPNQVPDELKEERKERLMAIQAEISSEILAAMQGSCQKVLVEKSLANEWPGLYAGRVWFQAPEIDGITYVSGPGVEPGAMPECVIEDSSTYDLTALA